MCINAYLSSPMTKPKQRTQRLFLYPRPAILQSSLSLFLALAIGIKHHRAITADFILGPGDMGTPVVDLVKGVVLRVRLLYLPSLRVQEHHIDAVAAATTGSLGDLEVALPVECEGVAAVGDGSFDESAGVICLFSVAFDELLAVLVYGRKVIVLSLLA